MPRHTRSKTSFVFHHLSTIKNSTNDRELLFGFEFPFTFVYFICLCYFRVFIAIRKNSFHVEEARLASVTIKEVRITKTVFAVLVGFLFCWLPAMVCNYLSFNMVNPRFPRQGESVFTFFLSVSSAINPVIYGTTCRSPPQKGLSSSSSLRKNYACKTNKGIMNKIIYRVERLVSNISGNLTATRCRITARVAITKPTVHLNQGVSFVTFHGNIPRYCNIKYLCNRERSLFNF